MPMPGLFDRLAVFRALAIEWGARVRIGVARGALPFDTADVKDDVNIDVGYSVLVWRYLPN